MIMMTCIVAATGDDDVRGLVLVKKNVRIFMKKEEGKQ